MVPVSVNLAASGPPPRRVGGGAGEIREVVAGGVLANVVAGASDGFHAADDDVEVVGGMVVGGMVVGGGAVDGAVAFGAVEEALTGPGDPAAEPPEPMPDEPADVRETLVPGLPDGAEVVDGCPAQAVNPAATNRARAAAFLRCIIGLPLRVPELRRRAVQLPQ